MEMRQDYQDWVIGELTEWAETFNNSYPNYMEEAVDHDDTAYASIHKLLANFKNNRCSKEDYENIIFHLWQKNHSRELD